jgi:hypothetical protein
MHDREVLAVRDDERARSHVRWWPQDEGYRVEAEGPWGTVSATASDAFAALAEVRRDLEEQGWRLAVAGARRDTYPSGMARDMGGGLKVYVMVDGRPAVELVDTFADAPPGLLATVGEQRANFEAWIRSVR